MAAATAGTKSPMPGVTGELTVSPNGPESTPVPDCICMRDKTYIYCKRCEFELPKGRVQRACSSHPRKRELMDLSMCPKCRGTSTLCEENDKTNHAN